MKVNEITENTKKADSFESAFCEFRYLDYLE